eukprot:7409263-Pyramimonas_sp.AAC.1
MEQWDKSYRERMPTEHKRFLTPIGPWSRPVTAMDAWITHRGLVYDSANVGWSSRCMAPLLPLVLGVAQKEGYALPRSSACFVRLEAAA